MVAISALATSLQFSPLKTDLKNQFCFVTDYITGILTQLLMQQGAKVP